MYLVQLYRIIMSIYIKNADTVNHTWSGQLVTPGQYYLLQSLEEATWANNSQLLSDIGSGKAIVARDNSGNTDISDINEAINYLKGIAPIEISVASTEKTTDLNLTKVATYRPEGSSSTKVSHDWCNKSTWYQNSTEVTGETMTDSGNQLTFNSTNAYWIDLEHGKVYNEYNIADKKQPKVYIDDVETTTGFSINYEVGSVTFDNAQTGTIKCDYWYGSNSLFTLAPDPGKIMIIEHAELQFSKNIQINTPINFEIWVYHPDQVTYPGVKVPYQVIKYKSMKDIINAANLGQGFIPACGELTQDILVFPFNYATVKPFRSSIGAELRVTADDNSMLGGEWGTATFYILSEDE